MARICVFCSGKADAPVRYLDDAARLGAVIAVPVVLVNTHGFYDGLLDWLRSRAEDGLMHDRLISAVPVVTAVEDALRFVPGGHQHAASIEPS